MIRYLNHDFNIFSWILLNFVHLSESRCLLMICQIYLFRINFNHLMFLLYPIRTLKVLGCFWCFWLEFISFSFEIVIRVHSLKLMCMIYVSLLYRSLVSSHLLFLWSKQKIWKYLWLLSCTLTTSSLIWIWFLLLHLL